MWSGQGVGGPFVAAAVVIAVAMAAAPPAQAGLQTWSGRWEMVNYASQKAGTSPASRPWEGDYGGVFNVSTECATGRCIATPVGGPKPFNNSIPQPLRFTWTGSDWTTSFDWSWNCYLADGPHRLTSPATSWVSYEPESDGSLKGSWHTDIASGPCRGSVIMPIAAFPR